MGYSSNQFIKTPSAPYDKYAAIIAQSRKEKNVQKRRPYASGHDAKNDDFDIRVFKVGARVKHTKFGEGNVKSLEDQYVIIEFDEQKVIKLQMEVCIAKSLLSFIEFPQEKEPVVIDDESSSEKKQEERTETEKKNKDTSEKEKRSISQNVEIDDKKHTNVISDFELKQGILEEIENYFDDDIEEYVSAFVTILKNQVDTEVLAGVRTTQYYVLKKIFNEESTYKDVKTYMSGALKIEAILKKILYYCDREKYQQIVDSKKGLAQVLKGLRILKNSTDITTDPNSFKNSLEEHIVRTYQLRNIDAHLCKNWTRRETFINLDSFLVTCIYAIQQNNLHVEAEFNQIDAEIDSIRESIDIDIWDVEEHNKECSECGNVLEYTNNILIEYGFENRVRKIRIKGYYCKECGRVFTLRSELAGQIVEANASSGVSKQKAKISQ